MVKMYQDFFEFSMAQLFLTAVHLENLRKPGKCVAVLCQYILWPVLEESLPYTQTGQDLKCPNSLKAEYLPCGP